MNKVVLFLLIALGAGLVSCESSIEAPAADAGFTTFYERFLSDEDYQLAHIVFPLEGLPPAMEDAAAAREFRWQRTDWQVHQPLDPVESGFRSSFLALENGLMVEQIRNAEGTYGMERRFARMGGEWYLIYYAGLNELQQ